MICAEGVYLTIYLKEVYDVLPHFSYMSIHGEECTLHPMYLTIYLNEVNEVLPHFGDELGGDLCRRSGRSYNKIIFYLTIYLNEIYQVQWR